MKINHNFFSNLAFNLAENHLGKTKYNPSVGCIVVRDKTVISSGVTSINGRPHAEYNALNKKMDFKISLAEWSLHRMLYSGKLDHLDFCLFAKKQFDIVAVEYVNSFFFDKNHTMLPGKITYVFY